MRIEIHEALPDVLAVQVAALEAQTWPGASVGHDPALTPRTVVLLDDASGDGTDASGEGSGAGSDGSGGRPVVASLALLYKPVRLADGRTYRAAGLSAVVTRPDARGRGYGARLVAAARAELAADPAVDLALFSCDRRLVPFYEAAGFEVLPGTVLVGGTPEDPLATDAAGFDMAVLAAFFTADGYDEGRTDEVRAAFTGIRVPLYPGTIDRLW